VTRAVLDLLEEMGPGALSMDEIAARAGVSKTTIYRRWESKDELIVDAIVGLVSTVHPPEAGEIREVLVTLLQRFRTFMTTAAAGSIFPWLVGEVSLGTELGRHYATAVILPRRQMIAEVIADGVAGGELRPDLDIEVAVDMLIGPPILRKLMGSFREPDAGWEEKLVDGLLMGWRVA
jgi:AcrR family transcriptional regulator